MMLLPLTRSSFYTVKQIFRFFEPVFNLKHGKFINRQGFLGKLLGK